MKIIDVNGQRGPIALTDPVTLIRAVSDVARVVASGPAGALYAPYPGNGQPRRVIALGVEFDANGANSAITANKLTGLEAVELEDVIATGYAHSGVYTSDVHLDATGCLFDGPGTAIHVARGGRVRVDDAHVVRGRCALIKSDTGPDGAVVNEGGVLRNVRLQRREEHRYWNLPGHETEALAVGPTSVRLASRPTFWTATPPPAQIYDQVRMVGQDGAIVLADVQYWYSQSDGSVEVVLRSWRHTDNQLAPAPAIGEARVIERKPIDIGGIHLTAPTRGWLLDGVVVDDGASDMITLRGDGHIARGCVVRRGRDCGFTLQGAHTLYDCAAEDVQFSAFVCVVAGGARLFRCAARGARGVAFDDRWGVTWDLMENCIQDGEG